LIDTCDTSSNLPVSVLKLCRFIQKQASNVLCGPSDDKGLVNVADNGH